MDRRYILLTLNLISQKLDLTAGIVIPEGYQHDEEAPDVTLVSAKFHTLHKFSEEIGPNFTDYVLPKTFQTLVFKCESNYPTYWHFKGLPYNNPSIKDYQITKARLVGENGSLFQDVSAYRFVSNLTLNFKNPDAFLDEIRCTRNRPLPKSVRNLTFSTSLTNSSNADPFNITIRITPRIEPKGSFGQEFHDRFGKNEDCNLTLQFDAQQKRFKCGQNSLPLIIPCNNADDCNAIFVVDDYNYDGNDFNGTCGNTTIITGPCNQSDCIQLNPSESPGVIVCRDGRGNSVARRYQMLRIRETNKSASDSFTLKLGRDIEANETIHLQRNESKVYAGQIVKFTCIGAGAYYSYGFRWRTIANDSSNMTDTLLDYDDGEERFNFSDHSYYADKIISFNESLVNTTVQVVCHGPRWNRVGWANCSDTILVGEPTTPHFTSKYEVLVKTTRTNVSGSDEERELRIFRCTATGKPTPEIIWKWGTETLDRNSARKYYTINHVSNYTSETVDSYLNVTLKPEAFHYADFHCLAKNYEGTVTITFPRPLLPWPAAIWISAVVCVCIVLLILVGAYFVVRKYRKRLQLLTDKEIDEFENGSMTANNDAFILPYSMENEIPQDDIDFQCSNLLGEGQFGIVYKGTYKSQKVAIKTIKKAADVKYFKAILSEIKIMCYVGKHDNLLNLVGACTRNLRKRQIFLVTEYCEKGNLLNFLRHSRGVCLDLFNSSKTAKECHNNMKLIDLNFEADTVGFFPCITTLNLVMWSYDISCAMEFLSLKKVIHGDIAARNVLLTSALVAKVCDFGLSKQLMEDYAIYVQKAACPLPLKWLAIESMQDFEFSIQSDIWAFGVTIWEIFSLGMTPYPGIPHWNFQCYTLLKKGYRMEKPEFSNDDIYNVMRSCWNETPSSRPSFTKLRKFFKQWIIKIKTLKH